MPTLSERGSPSTAAPDLPGDDQRAGSGQADDAHPTTATRSRLQTWAAHRTVKGTAWVASLAVAVSATVAYEQIRDAGNGDADFAISASRGVHRDDAAPSADADTGPDLLPQARGPQPGRRTPQSGQRTLTDRSSGYELSYPENWTATPTSAGHLLRIDKHSALSISTFRLEHPVTTSDVDDLRAVTDAILSSPSADITVLAVRNVEVGGLRAVYYLYYFHDKGQRGIHAHYFVFDGTRMHTLVFQVVPASRFADHAAQFDDVVASFAPLTH